MTGFPKHKQQAHSYHPKCYNLKHPRSWPNGKQKQKEGKENLFKVVDHIAVHGGPEVAQLADVGHLTGTVVLTHVGGQRCARLVVLLTDTAHQHVHIVHVHLQQDISTLTLFRSDKLVNRIQFVHSGGGREEGLPQVCCQLSPHELCTRNQTSTLS